MKQIRFMVWAALVLLMTTRPVAAEINVALIVPSDRNGNELAAGAFRAAEAINARGGIAGNRLNLQRIEDPCEDVLSQTTAEMLALKLKASQELDLVVGPYCRNNAAAIAELYRQKHIYQILPIPASRALYAKAKVPPLKFLGYVEEQAKIVPDFYLQNGGDKPFAFVYNANDEVAVATAKALSAQFDKRNLADRFLTFSYDNYADNLNKMAKTLIRDSGMVYLTGQAGQILALLNQIRNRDMALPIIISQFDKPADLSGQFGNYTQNVYLLRLSSLKDNPYFAENLVQLRLSGVEPEGLMPYGYLLINFVGKSLEYKGKDVFARMNAALKHHNDDLGWGSNGFRQGLPEKAPGYVLEPYDAGE